MSGASTENGGGGNQRLKVEGSLSKTFALREEGKLNSGCRGSGVKGFSAYFSHVGGIRASVPD